MQHLRWQTLVDLPRAEIGLRRRPGAITGCHTDARWIEVKVMEGAANDFTMDRSPVAQVSAQVRAVGIDRNGPPGSRAEEDDLLPHELPGEDPVDRQLARESNTEPAVRKRRQ